MKSSIPLIYWTYRMAWTGLHFIIVAAMAAALLSWALADSHAVRIWETSKTNVLEAQKRVSNAIPWPWATDDNGDGSPGASPNSDDDQYGQSRGQFQVIGKVTVRRAPNGKSKKVGTLSDGTWITVDCITQGSRVDPGPYKTSLRAYSGQDFGATSLWVHISGSGYVSDAYVSTNNGSGLPQC
jgi:hypothetical protein